LEHVTTAEEMEFDSNFREKTSGICQLGDVLDLGGTRLYCFVTSDIDVFSSGYQTSIEFL
jgi:hypothetical protein